MKNRILVHFLVIILILTASGLQAAPVQADPASIGSIYFTSAELDELRTLATAPSHSTIWSNIVTWADAHVGDAPVAQPTGVKSEWLEKTHIVRRYIETMGFMYAMTENTTYADAAIDWMLSVSSWGSWGSYDKMGYFTDAELLRGFSFGYSVCYDYMTTEQRQTILDAMVSNIEDIFDVWLPMFPQWFYDGPNHGGTLAACVGLAAIAIGDDHPDSGTWLNSATMGVQEVLDCGGDDGGFFEGPGYTMNLFSHVVPFLDALKRAGTDLFTGNSFLENHAYYYIYLSSTLSLESEGEFHSFMGMEDYEERYGYRVDVPAGYNALDCVYRLAKEYNNPYAQEFADLYCDQSVIQSFIWKSPSLTPLPLDGLPTARLFDGIGYVVLKSGWGDNDLSVVFKSGRSRGHAQASQNGFTIYYNGKKLTGQTGYSIATEEDDTFAHNCLLVDGLGQAQERTIPLGTRGIIEQLDNLTPYYVYTRGDASAVYPGGESIGDLDRWDRHLVMVQNPYYLVIYDDIEASSESQFDLLLNENRLPATSTSATPLEPSVLDVDGNLVTIAKTGARLETLVLEPSDFLYEIEHFYIDKGWYVHDYDYVKVRPPVESTEAQFLTVLFPLAEDGSVLPTERVSVGNVIGARVTDGDNLYLTLFSSDGKPVSEYIELGGYYQSADGNSYTFNGTQVLAEFDTYQVMRLQKPRPPVLVSIGNKSINEGELLEFIISATDPNDDDLTYSADLTSLPAGASFDPATATFSWTPGAGQAGTYSNVHFEVSDGDLTDSEDITITVNGPPVLAPIGDKSVNEGELLDFTVSATDPNDDTLTYSADLTSLPPGASFDPATATFSWTPNFDQAGTYSDVHFEVSDGELTDSEDIIIKVGLCVTSLVIICVSILILITLTVVSILLRRRRTLRTSGQI